MGNEFNNYVGPNYYNPRGYSSVIQQTMYKNQLTIQLNKFDYFKGDYVEGKIVLNNMGSLILNDIHLNLYLVERWNYQDSERIESEFNHPMLLTVKIGIQKIVKIESDIINLNPGVFNLPFKFKLPDYLQPCFEYPKNNQKGFLRYILEAKIISPYVKGFSRSYLFIKSRPLILNCPLSYSSATNVHKWGMFDQGSTILKVSYLTSNYQIRGQIPITVEINNTRGKLQVRNVNCKIIRRVQFKKVNLAVTRYTLQTIILNKVFDVNVPPNTQSQVYNYNIELTDSTLANFNYIGALNPYPSLGDLLYAMPTTDGAAIKCDYYLLVSLSFSSYVTQSYIPKVCIPFTITHQLQSDYNLEQQEEKDMKQAIEASLLDSKQVEDINKTNINEIVLDQNKNEIMLNGNNLQNNKSNEQKSNFVDINQIEDNNYFNEMNNQGNINEINNNLSYNMNNNMNVNNNNNNNLNINQISNEFNHEGNLNNIKINDNDNEIINPYLSSLENKEQNNFGSINDFEDDNDDNNIK